MDNYFHYRGDKEDYEYNNNLSWDQYSIVQEVRLEYPNNYSLEALISGQEIVDDITLEIIYPDQYLSLYICRGDSRTLDSMDATPCDLDPEGCCFEHPGCGKEDCLEHYPLQKIGIEFKDYAKLIGNKIVDFYKVEGTYSPGDYNPHDHDFIFELSSESQVIKEERKIKFSVTNSDPNYYISVDT